MARIILIRHGQTEWNRVERFRGRADLPLNATGLAQAEATGHHVVARWKPVAVYSSPLSRAVKTAEAVARHFELPVQVHPGLADIDYGAWQGLSPEKARQRWPEVVYTWYNQPHLARIPDGETLDELRQRPYTCSSMQKELMLIIKHLLLSLRKNDQEVMMAFVVRKGGTTSLLLLRQAQMEKPGVTKPVLRHKFLLM